jgi:hypothetical protein
VGLALGRLSKQNTCEAASLWKKSIGACVRRGLVVYAVCLEGVPGFRSVSFEFDRGVLRALPVWVKIVF